MKLKSFFWTGLIAVLLFFLVVYLGIKYDWVNEAEPKFPAKHQSTSSTPQATQQSAASEAPQPAAVTGNGSEPELVEEPLAEPDATDSPLLGSTALGIEDIVTQCQNIATSVGIPAQQFDQAVLECIDRNSGHLQETQNVIDERTLRIREQCDLAITQRDLLSVEEIKMLVDECVASMQ